MRKLFVLRGISASGKSSAMRSLGLGPWTLSSDQLRLMMSGPTLSDEGRMVMPKKRDGEVWKLFVKILEERMAHGETTILDATHLRESSLTRYKDLCERYAYRAYLVEMPKIPLEEALRRNAGRPSLEYVPEDVIRMQHEQALLEITLDWCPALPLAHLQDAIEVPVADVSRFQSIHILGDIRGCSGPLASFFREVPKSDHLYIFTGGFFGGGGQNGDVARRLIQLAERDNVVMIEDYHDRHMRCFARGEKTRSPVFEEKTKLEFANAGLQASDFLPLVEKLVEAYQFALNGKRYIVTHAGIARDVSPFELGLLSTRLLTGHGLEYDMNIDEVFANAASDHGRQVHGYRNPLALPIQASRKSFNLEGSVERGGELRILTLTAYTP